MFHKVVPSWTGLVEDYIFLVGGGGEVFNWIFVFEPRIPLYIQLQTYSYKEFL